MLLIHGQVIIDAVLAIRTENDVRGEDVARVNLEVFQGAYDFAGGGAYGDKDHPRTKEQADYNLKYLSAVALLDGGVGPEQLETERVLRADVQELLARVDVRPAADLTADYPQRTAARVHVVLHDGREFSREESDYEGSRPSRCPGTVSWTSLVGSPSRSATRNCAPILSPRSTIWTRYPSPNSPHCWARPVPPPNVPAASRGSD